MGKKRDVRFIELVHRRMMVLSGPFLVSRTGDAG